MAPTEKQTDPVNSTLAEGAAHAAPRRRRKSLRRQFCEGIEAAVQAEPSAFRATRPRTMMSLMVRELVSAAGRGRSDAIRTVMGFLDEAEARRNAAESEGVQSQGNSAAQSPEPRWEWTETGEWDSSEREAPGTDPHAPDAYTYPEPGQETHQALCDRLFTKCVRAYEADCEEAERKARLAVEREGRSAPRAEAANSGNIPAPGPQVRIAGRIVEG
ncbi:MAG: hypothetical protein ACREHF_11030 [Rhizomicrobium sp.]